MARDNDKKNDNKMAEAKRIELHARKKEVKQRDQKNDPMLDLYKDLQEIDNLLNDQGDLSAE